jgi:1A family penicillin-binding protein
MSAKKRTLQKIKKPLFYAGLTAILLIGIFSIWAMTLNIPDFEAFNERKIIESTKIYDRTGQILLYDIHNNIRRTIVPFSEIPRHIKNATVAIEDSNFYNHRGVDFLGIARAFLINIFHGQIRQGGSTITQQLVKNTLLTPTQTIERKLKEIILAFKVEKKFSKEEILNLYLNEVPYGSAAYGVAAAAEIYFNKKIQDISLAEAAYLAAMTKAPTFYSPYGSRLNQLENRKNLVLKRMNELGFISQQEMEKAGQDKVSFTAKGNETLKAPHFVFFVREYLAEKYGEEMIDESGLKVITTLDWNLQQKAEELVKKFIEEEEEKFNVFNAGLAATDPSTGQILAMVGSKDWFADPKPKGCSPGLNCKFEPQVNVASYASGRQPGSAFKPFVYATAFKKGYTPETVLFDLPTEFNPDCDPEIKPDEQNESENKENKCYHPKNYNEIFRGPVTLREALAQSINLPAVKTLYLSGLSDSLKTARDMGIATLNDPNRYGLTLVLGGGEVRLLEMVGAYGVFGNDGIKNNITPIIKIEDSRGNILEEWFPRPEKVLEPQVARLINDILSDNKSRTPAFGESSYLYIPDYQVAVKTGTTNDFRDAWVIGYVPNFALGVWFGNNDNTPMEKKVAGFIAAPLWNAFFKEVLKNIDKKNFTPPDPIAVSKPVLKGEWRGSLTYTIDKISGKRATSFTPAAWRQEKPLTQIHSILYWLNKDDPSGPIPENSQKDPQFENWEYAVKKWAQNQNIRNETSEDIPKEFDDVHKPEYAPATFWIQSPPEEISAYGNFSLSLTASGRFPIKQIDILLGSRLLGSIQNPPYSFWVDLSRLNNFQNQELLTVNVYDSVGNSSQLQKEIKIQSI